MAAKSGSDAIISDEATGCKGLADGSRIWGLILSRDFHLPLEAPEHGSRIGGVGPDPALVNGMDRQGVEMVPALPAAPFGHDEASVFEDAQMLHDGAAVELGKLLAEHASGERRGFKRVENAPPYAMAEGLEYSIIQIVI